MVWVDHPHFYLHKSLLFYGASRSTPFEDGFDFFNFLVVLFPHGLCENGLDCPKCNMDHTMSGGMFLNLRISNNSFRNTDPESAPGSLNDFMYRLS